MGISQSGDLKRKKSGGRRRSMKDKRKYELGNVPTLTVIGKKDVRKKVKTLSARPKVKLKRALKANVLDSKTGKYQVVELLTEKENPANRNYPRMNIVTKGALIETKIGTVRITSRPGQHGSVNAVLIEKK